MSRDATPCRVRLVRHAESEGNALGRMVSRSDPDLSPRGVTQADELAARLRRGLVSDPVVVTSPLVRALRTAEAISAAWGGVQIHTDARLQELDFGELEGVQFLDLLESWPPDWVRDPTVACPGGESYSHLLERVGSALDEWVAATRAEGQSDIVFVTHLGPVKVLVTDVLGGHWPVLDRVVISHASISTVEIDTRGRRLLDLNLSCEESDAR
ncbi:MAG: histidine phosphatase family protein [Acidimicrobiia bacterium]|nr:histidine phosphatase family protein [Acidimicrobiia bacterium]